jgi:hypothetical protein
MRVFFKKMGIENLRFKPAYNPYTEVRVQSRSPQDKVPIAIAFLSSRTSHPLKFLPFIRC